jgi:hypothetical protein
MIFGLILVFLLTLMVLESDSIRSVASQRTTAQK